MKKMIVAVFYILFAFITTAQSLQPQEQGSSVKFVIKNFGINTAGSFEGLTGTIQYDLENPVNSVFDVSVKAETVDTDIKARDNHLRKDEFFDVANFPHINLKSSKVTLTNSEDHLYFFGTLTIKGISKEIKFPFTVKTTPDGYLFQGSFKVNRREFNLGGKSISLDDEVKVELSVLAR